MYGESEKSQMTRYVFVVVHAAIVGYVAWLLFGGGIGVAARWFGWDIAVGDGVRRVLLLICALVYFLRLCFGVLYLVQRRFGWAEAGIILPWIWIFDTTFGLIGGTNPEPVGIWAVLGLVLFAVGSYLNTGSEYQRRVWKRRPENKGRLYTEGLFRYSMHVNYFGDVVLFTGFALVTGRVVALVIPVFMLCGFAFVNVPQLDRYLAGKYGADFEGYAGRTRRLVPWVW